MKKYKSWKYRYVPFFKEEIVGGSSSDLPSIEEFREKDAYSHDVRILLVTYLEQCVLVVSTSYKRYNLHEQKYLYDLSYYTDGEVIFNNFLFDYVRETDFVLPKAWFDAIQAKQFKLAKFRINESLMIENNIDIFLTSGETFEELPTIRKVIEFDVDE